MSTDTVPSGARTPEEMKRLLAEAVPNGRFGGRLAPSAPSTVRLPAHLSPTDPETAAEHARVLDAEAATFRTGCALARSDAA